MIVNDHFANDSDYMILSESSDETQALLPPRIKTMEVVGDDLDLSYDDAIYLATGWYPKDERCMGLSARFTRAGLMAPRLIETPSSGALSIAGIFGSMHVHSYSRNLIAIEPSFLCCVAGVMEDPNNAILYYGSESEYRSERWRSGSSPGAAVLDRGAPHTVDELTNPARWLADPLVEDIADLSGDIGSEKTINYFLGGEVRFSEDVDPQVITADTAADTLTVTTESSEGAEVFPSLIDSFGSLGELQHFPVAVV